MSRIKVFIVDDHPIFLEGVRKVIESDIRMTVVGSASNVTDALTQIKTAKPQVAIVDIHLREASGLDLTRSLQNFEPPVATIILTMHKEEHFVLGALDRGAKGYVLKENALSELIGAIERVAQGEYYVTPALSGCLIKRTQRSAELAAERPALAKLTAMERCVLKLVAESKTSKEIGRELFISPRTVEAHRANICGKLELHGSHKLLQFALAHKTEL